MNGNVGGTLPFSFSFLPFFFPFSFLSPMVKEKALGGNEEEREV